VNVLDTRSPGCGDEMRPANSLSVGVALFLTDRVEPSI